MPSWGMAVSLSRQLPAQRAMPSVAKIQTDDGARYNQCVGFNPGLTYVLKSQPVTMSKSTNYKLKIFNKIIKNNVKPYILNNGIKYSTLNLIKIIYGSIFLWRVTEELLVRFKKPVLSINSIYSSVNIIIRSLIYFLA